MVTHKTTVETEVADEVEVTYCDSCGDPVGDEFDNPYEVLSRNPRIKKNQNRLSEAAVRSAKSLMAKAERGDLHEESVQDMSGRAIGYTLDGCQREVSMLKSSMDQYARLETDGDVDVCYRCLKERLCGPDEPMYGILMIDEDMTESEIIAERRRSRIARAFTFATGILSVVLVGAMLEGLMPVSWFDALTIGWFTFFTIWSYRRFW